MNRHTAPRGIVATLGPPQNNVLVVKNYGSQWRYVSDGEVVPAEDFNLGLSEYFYEGRIDPKSRLTGPVISCARCLDQGTLNPHVLMIANDTKDGNHAGDLLCYNHSKDLKGYSIEELAPDSKQAEELGKVSSAGDELAAAAARVCAEYDGIHRLRAALSKWFDVRAGIHGSKGE